MFVGSHWHNAVICFFYPGILGSIFFSILDHLMLDGKYDGLSLSGGLAIVAVLAIFYGDFLYTKSDCVDPARYHLVLAVIDLTSVVLAFVAVNLALQHDSIAFLPALSLSAALFAKKGLALAWEYLRLDGANTRAVLYYGFFGGFYLLFWVFSTCLCVVVFLLCLDAAIGLLGPFRSRNNADG